MYHNALHIWGVYMNKKQKIHLTLTQHKKIKNLFWVMTWTSMKNM